MNKFDEMMKDAVAKMEALTREAIEAAGEKAGGAA